LRIPEIFRDFQRTPAGFFFGKLRIVAEADFTAFLPLSPFLLFFGAFLHLAGQIVWALFPKFPTSY